MCYFGIPKLWPARVFDGKIIEPLAVTPFPLDILPDISLRSHGRRVYYLSKDKIAAIAKTKHPICKVLEEHRNKVDRPKVEVHTFVLDDSRHALVTFDSSVYGE